MSELRKRMNDAMVLRGLAERTRQSYLYWVGGLAKYLRRAPDALDAGEVQSYLLHLISEKMLAYASVNQAACAIRFFFAVVLGQPSVAYEIPMAKVPKRLPRILTREEIAPLFAHCRDPRSRTLLMTTYAAGSVLTIAETYDTPPREQREAGLKGLDRSLVPWAGALRAFLPHGARSSWLPG